MVDPEHPVGAGILDAFRPSAKEAVEKILPGPSGSVLRTRCSRQQFAPVTDRGTRTRKNGRLSSDYCSRALEGKKKGRRTDRRSLSPSLRRV